MGWPPWVGSKKWVLRCRSAHNKTKAAVSTGKASSTRNAVTSWFQQKMGMRNMTMPGARRQNTVVITLTAVKMPDKPARATPQIHRSPPTPGEWIDSVSGAYANQPQSAAPDEVRKPESIVTQPPRYSQ